MPEHRSGQQFGPAPDRLARDPALLRAIQLLESLGTDRVRHTLGRSLLGHLVDTAGLLRAWHAPRDVVRAGLCHSIYGTQAFRRVSLDPGERMRLRAAIGVRAERLVWHFATLQRPRSLICAMQQGHCRVLRRDGRSLRLSRPMLQALWQIEYANLADQGLGIRRAALMQRAARHAATQHPVQRAMLDALARQTRQRRSLSARARHAA